MLRATVTLALALAAPAAFAQSVISARSGLVHYTEGPVAIDGEPLAMQFGRFPMLQNGETISTENGYAEVLLAPGSFLRLGPDTSVKFVSNSLDATRFEILSGSAMVEVTQIAKDATISVDVCGEETVIAKRGLYEFDADLSRVRVYDGKLVSDTLDKDLTKGRMVAFDGDPDIEKFKTKDRNHLYFWSQNRSQYLASANLGSASSARKGFITSNSWVWNSYLSTFTFIPVSGTSRSPFGWYWYSQPTVWIVSAPPSRGGWSGGDAGGSWGGIQSRGASPAPSGGDSGGAVRSAAPAAAPAASAGGGRSR